MQTCARARGQPGSRPSCCPGGLQPSREGEPSPGSHPALHWSPREGRVTCWWPWGWKEKHRRPLQGHSGTRCHPIPHMRLTTVWVPGGPGSRRGHQGGFGARRKARRESCVPGRVLPPAPGFVPRFRLEPCGRGAGAEPNPENPPQGNPQGQSQPGKSPPAHRTAPAHPPWQGRSPPRAAARTPSTPGRSPGEPRADQHPGQRAGKPPQGLGGTPGALRTPGDGGQGSPSSP